MNVVTRKLLRWYERNQRDLPWRKTRAPYRIWVAETMLQQTRVETVIPYYRRFLARWPTVGALARAELDDVLKVWEGLGYYARARNLHRGAQELTNRLGGKLPNSADLLRTIPGIGRYTAGAIASIAFGRDEPTMDGNIRRVLSRLLAVRGDPRAPATQKRLWKHAARLLPEGRAGDFNQGLMDLGAIVCVAKAPRCHLCPLRKDCCAFQMGLQDQLPVKVAKKPMPHYRIAVGVIWKGGRILIAQRPRHGLLGGLWEFAGGKCRAGESLKHCCEREVREELGIGVKVGDRLATVRHSYTHFGITIYAFHCEYAGGSPRPLGAERLRWVRPDELNELAWPAANKRIIQEIIAISPFPGRRH